jgi:hypothetical protein
MKINLLVGGLAVIGAVSIVLGVVQLHADHHEHPPALGPPTAAEMTTRTPPSMPRLLAPLPRSVPIMLDVPAIGVHSALLQLGLNRDNTVEVPPLDRDSKAGWYRYSPTPGEKGPAVILGHVDSARYGPGVFYRLGQLKSGDIIQVTRTDSTVALFHVERVAEYRKSAFPTAQVYGNVDYPALRLITCGGDFDAATGNYSDNVVVYALL